MNTWYTIVLQNIINFIGAQITNIVKLWCDGRDIGLSRVIKKKNKLSSGKV